MKNPWMNSEIAPFSTKHLNSSPFPTSTFSQGFKGRNSGNLNPTHDETVCKPTSEPLKPLSSTTALSIENRTTTSPGGTKLITSCDMWNKDAFKRNPFPICPSSSKRASSSSAAKLLSTRDVLLKFAILILFLNQSAEASSSSSNSLIQQQQSGVQADQDETAAAPTNTSSSILECYVCLPGDKTSAEAKAILALFPIEGNYSIPDCIAFADHNAHQFLFPCPPNYKGCSRHMGPDASLVSRNCASMGIDSCANSTSTNTEYCFCTGSKCNGAKPLPVFPMTSSSSSTPHTWTDLETDDEDLLPKEDDDGVEGSGSYGPDQPSNNNGSGGGSSSSNRHNKGHEKYDTYPHQRKFFPSTHKNSQGNKAQSTASSARRAISTALSTGAHCLVLLLSVLVLQHRVLRLLL